MLLTMGAPREYIYGNKKEEIVPQFGLTGRQLMQTLGTEWGRNMVCSDVWVKSLENYINHLPSNVTHIVLDDLRFMNEFEWADKMGAYLLKLKRSTVVSPWQQWWKNIFGHQSERVFMDYIFHDVIDNNWTISNLESTAYRLVVNAEFNHRSISLL
jgi:hypothetical protein